MYPAYWWSELLARMRIRARSSNKGVGHLRVDNACVDGAV